MARQDNLQPTHFPLKGFGRGGRPRERDDLTSGSQGRVCTTFFGVSNLNKSSRSCFSRNNRGEYQIASTSPASSTARRGCQKKKRKQVRPCVRQRAGEKPYRTSRRHPGTIGLLARGRGRRSTKTPSATNGLSWPNKGARREAVKKERKWDGRRGSSCVSQDVGPMRLGSLPSFYPTQLFPLHFRRESCWRPRIKLRESWIGSACASTSRRTHLAKEAARMPHKQCGVPVLAVLPTQVGRACGTRLRRLSSLSSFPVCILFHRHSLGDILILR